MKKIQLEIEKEDISQAFFTSYDQDGNHISFFGDGHPYYAGSVVKAMASAKNGYKKIAELFEDDIRKAEQKEYVPPQEELEKFFLHLDHQFKPKVVSVEKLTPTITEIVVHAPAAAKHFQPGEFYRMQNYETDPIIIDGKSFTMEALAMTGAWTDPEKGLDCFNLLKYIYKKAAHNPPRRPNVLATIDLLKTTDGSVRFINSINLIKDLGQASEMATDN